MKHENMDLKVLIQLTKISLAGPSSQKIFPASKRAIIIPLHNDTTKQQR